MEDEYLTFKFPNDKSELPLFLLSLPKEKGILFSIEYLNFTLYGISTGHAPGAGAMKYHNLNGPAFVYKNNYKYDQYWIYSEYLGDITDTTFEEFKIKRDRFLKEMVFK